MCVSPSKRKAEKGSKPNESCTNMCTNPSNKSANMQANIMVTGQDMVGIMVELSVGL
jgi:hypothetical protein